MIIQYNDLISFEKGLQLQKQSHTLVKEKGRPVLLGCEHYPVITLGKRTSQDDEFFASRAELFERGFEICHTDRGGQATIHSPGQLVIYPIVPLRNYSISVREFITILEKTTIAFLKIYKISSFLNDEVGVFTDKGKIAFIGIRVENGVSRHGISINISNSLQLFDWIRACGLNNRPLDSMTARGVFIDMKTAFDQWTGLFISQMIKKRESILVNEVLN